MTNKEIRQALTTDIKIIIEETAPNHYIDLGKELLNFGNPHQEFIRNTQQTIEIVDFHFSNISFGLPFECVTKIFQQLTPSLVGSYLLIEGIDQIGNTKFYKCLITHEFLVNYKWYYALLMKEKEGIDSFIQILKSV